MARVMPSLEIMLTSILPRSTVNSVRLASRLVILLLVLTSQGVARRKCLTPCPSLRKSVQRKLFKGSRADSLAVTEGTHQSLKCLSIPFDDDRIWEALKDVLLTSVTIHLSPRCLIFTDIGISDTEGTFRPER